MKLLLVACLFVFSSAENASSAERNHEENSSLTERSIGYHQKQGVPQAERLRIVEAVGARIANGHSSALIEHPYVAGLLVTLTTGQTSLCGGTLLNTRRVLTAATCWYDGYSQGTDILVVLGSIHLYSGGTRVWVTQIITHPDFNPYSRANDIAMLVIPFVINSNAIRPATLPYGPYMSYSFLYWNAEATGFGKTSEGSNITSSQTRRAITVTVISNEECQLYYGSAVSSNVICTNATAAKGGPCDGDMGGPLILKYFKMKTYAMLIGVLSLGSASGCEAGHPTFSTRITGYISWIQNLM